MRIERQLLQRSEGSWRGLAHGSKFHKSHWQLRVSQACAEQAKGPDWLSTPSHPVNWLIDPQSLSLSGCLCRWPAGQASSAA